MKKLEFKFPFYRFSGLDFYNCYASVYLFLQGATAKNTEYYCQAIEGKGCNECWKCADSLQTKSEVLNNLFGTILRGQWITRQSWLGEKTKIQKEFDAQYGDAGTNADKIADFLTGFTGYRYKKITEKFKENIVSSIDAGKPVIAKIKEPKVKNDEMFRVIIGYDGDALTNPDYRPADNAPTEPTIYDEIEYIYIFGEKIPQKYTFIDVLKIIEKSMDSDFAEGIWNGFLQKFDYDGEKLWELDASEIKSRFIRLRAVSGWIPNIGHGLGLTFGDKDLLKELGMDVGRVGELIDTIRHQGHLIHNRGYMISAICTGAIAINVNDDDKWPWDNHGLITAVYQILELIMECDKQILTAVKAAIRESGK